MKEKLAAWKRRYLSLRERITLIKAPRQTYQSITHNHSKFQHQWQRSWKATNRKGKEETKIIHLINWEEVPMGKKKGGWVWGELEIENGACCENFSGGLERRGSFVHNDNSRAVGLGVGGWGGEWGDMGTG